jgi:hypothetical protein
MTGGRGHVARPTTVADRRGFMRARRLLAIVITILVVACSGPDAAHYEAVLDGLHLPAGWELVHTTIMRSGGPDTRIDPSRSQDDIACDIGHCPSVARYYLVEGKPADAYPEARQSAIDAGFEIGRETGPKCDLPPGGDACDLNATKGSDELLITLYKPGDGSDGVGVADAGKFVIRIIASRQK